MEDKTDTFNIMEHSKHKKRFDNFVKLKQNSKEPATKWKLPENRTKHEIKGNYGIITGKANNLLILDIDNKEKYDKRSRILYRHGVDEFAKYVAEFGEPDTLKVETPSGGYHYYFNYSSTNENDNYLITNYLTNRSGYRTSCLDIRSNGGYIVGPNSKIDKRKYKIMDNNSFKISDIPSSLITFLLESQTIEPRSKKDKEETTNNVSIKSNNDFTYVISDEQIVAILNELGPIYCSNYDLWLKATTALKKLNKFDIWMDWCKKGDNFDYEKNLAHWKYNQGVIDINYLVVQINTKRDPSNRMPFIPKYKPFIPITADISKIKKFNMDHHYLYDEGKADRSFNYNLFKDHETIIIKSCTGTGKTTSIAKHCRRYMTEYRDVKLFTITDKITLSDQHFESFQQQNINIIHYKNLNRFYNTDEDALTVCINSIRHISELNDDELNDYIVYIDEISSFLNYTHNSTLDRRLKDVHHNLIRIVKHAHKVIVSDAMIKDNTFEFLKHRSMDDMLFVEIKFLKFQGVPAVWVRDDKAFLDLLLEHCVDEQYFLFGADSCEVVTAFFHQCYDQYPGENKEEKFILITADTNFKLENASEQFKNKFVFYSPKIVTAVDFTIETKQDVFIYIKGHTIDPAASFQQTTRTRNIKTLYFYSESINGESRYCSIEDLEESINKTLSASKEFLDLCTYIDEDDNMTVVKNMFYKLYIYNEYVQDIYRTNKTEHYKLILKENGFQISEKKRVNIDGDAEEQSVKEIMDDIREELFNDYLKATPSERQHNKFSQLRSNLEYLKIERVDNDTLTTFKDIVINKYNVYAYDNFIMYLKTDQ